MKRLFRASVALKLALLVAGAVVGFVVLALVAVNETESQVRADRDAKTQEHVEAAIGVLEHFGQMETEGLLTRGEAQMMAADVLRGMRYDGDQYFWINDGHPNVVMHPIKPELDGTDASDITDPNGVQLFVEFANMVDSDGAGFVRYQWPKPGSEVDQPKVAYVAGFDRWGWIVGTGIYVDDVDAIVASARTKVFVIGGLIALMLIVGATVLTRRIVRPLRAVAEASDEMVTGDLTNLARVAEALADGDLTVAASVDARQVPVTSRDEIGMMATSFNRMQQRIGDIGDAFTKMVTELRTVVGSAADVTRQVDDGSDALAQASEESARVATEVATSTSSVADGASDQANISERLSESVAQIVSEIEAASEAFAAVIDASSDADDKVANGTGELVEATAAMGRITDVFSLATGAVAAVGSHSERVEEIVGLIRSIAEQTNLLALNAAIEAARAGEMGRGFAVVASEVKGLAEESASSTDKIAAIVDEMQQSVHTAADAMASGKANVESSAGIVVRAADSFEAIGHAMNLVAIKVESAAAATTNIRSATDSIGQGARQLVEITESASAATAEVAAASEQSAATSQEIGATAQELATSATDLGKVMQRFKI